MIVYQWVLHMYCRKTRIYLFIFFAMAFMGVPSLPVIAEDSSPSLPESLQGLIDKGAQIKYLGRVHNLDGWIMVYRGKEEYFYVTPDSKAFVSGILFSEQGDPITIDQIRKLQDSGNAQILDSLLSRKENEFNVQSELGPQTPVVQSPAEELFRDVADANWVVFGQRGAPVVYAFIDPTCPHCHDFVAELRANFIDQGQIELRIMPVSRFTNDPANLQKAAFLLASPQPQQDFYNHMDGQNSALPDDGELNTQAVQQNMAIMQKWQLDAIPFIIYRSKSGQVKIIRGKVKDPSLLISDLG